MGDTEMLLVTSFHEYRLLCYIYILDILLESDIANYVGTSTCYASVDIISSLFCLH